mmetsp:Transcript_25970/g.65259  ORF Transcript_25970/g.65259 Transcript_25970/m.65259 type:complete len:147 (+) Transcript_25970:194-634(+)
MATCLLCSPWRNTGDSLRRMHVRMTTTLCEGTAGGATWLWCSPLRNTGGSRLDARAKNNHALRRSCESGHLAAVQFLAEHWGLMAEDAGDNHPLRWSCFFGHLAMVQFLADHWELTPEDARAEDNFALCRSCEVGCLSVVQFLAEH